MRTVEAASGTSAVPASHTAQIDPSKVWRKKHREVPLKPSDSTGWYQNGGTHLLVFRSPADPSVWVDRDTQRESVERLVRAGARFAGRKGQRILLNPKPGDEGYFSPDGRGRRSRQVLTWTYQSQRLGGC